MVASTSESVFPAVFDSLFNRSPRPPNRMFPKLVPSLLVLSALCGSYAAPSDNVNGVAVALSRLGFGTDDIISAITLGSDSSRHTSYSILFAVPETTATTATAPDTTVTAAVTLVEGSTDAHLVQAVTFEGQTMATVSDDCALSSGLAACTFVMKDTAGSVIWSTVATVTALSAPTASATSTNSAGQVGVVGALVLAVVTTGVTLVGAMV